MKFIYTLLLTAIMAVSQPALAGVNKTIAAVNGDLQFVMSKVEKNSDYFQSLTTLKNDFKKVADNSWKMARHEFYAYASGVYDKMKEISTAAKVAAPAKPDWL